MLLHVLFQVALLSKPGTSDMAPKGPLAQMHPGMIDKVPSFYKSFLAPSVLSMNDPLLSIRSAAGHVAEFILIVLKDLGCLCRQKSFPIWAG